MMMFVKLSDFQKRLCGVASDLCDLARRATSPPAQLMTREQRDEVEALIYDGSQLTSSYSFLLFSACGIAALGLLQSSVAVVIGAMLISPLMGPILAMGMAMATLRPYRFRRAALILAAGAVLAILASTLIVSASPLKDATPEILARTRPTLLDLVVAFLTGLVGAYLAINQKGAAIAGVAIATALMPPLAVTGYGIATGAWMIAGGAFLLFITNVVAILGAVLTVAWRYGFKPARKKEARREVTVLLVVIGLLCVPLALSLQSIVAQARETVRARQAIVTAFEGEVAHITDLYVQVRRGRTREVDTVVVTPRYQPSAAQEVAGILGGNPTVDIEQIVTAGGVPLAEAGALGARPQPTASLRNASVEQRLDAMLSRVGDVQSIERREEAFVVTFAMDRGSDLGDYRASEHAAQRFITEGAVWILPPLTDLPVVRFARGHSQLTPDGLEVAETIAWATERWGISAVEVTGLATPGARGPRPIDRRLAENRANALAERLRELGVEDVRVRGEVPETLEGEESDLWIARVRLLPG